MDPRSPRGMSLDGFLVSSAMVAMLSNPPYAKYTIAAARNTPGTPCGMNGVRFFGFAWTKPTTMTNSITITCTADATQLMRDVPLALSMAVVAVTAITTTATGSSSLYPSVSDV